MLNDEKHEEAELKSQANLPAPAKHHLRGTISPHVSTPTNCGEADKGGSILVGKVDVAEWSLRGSNLVTQCSKVGSLLRHSKGQMQPSGQHPSRGAVRGKVVVPLYAR